MEKIDLINIVKEILQCQIKTFAILRFSIYLIHHKTANNKIVGLYGVEI